MPSFAPVSEQLLLLEQGVVDFLVRGELEQRLEESRRSGKPLRIKAGFDPTRPDLHLGHCVLLQKMRVFQDLGHNVIFLIGDVTAMVGDPTGHNEARPRRTRAEVERGRGHLSVPGVQGPRRQSGRGATKQRMARQDGDGGHRRAHGQVHRLAHARAEGLSPALRRRQTDSSARVPLPAPPGVRLGRARIRCRARRHRSALQPHAGPRRDDASTASGPRS